MRSLILLALLIPTEASFPQQRDSSSINYYRLGVMGGITAAAVTGSYLYVKNYWWAKQQSNFHFENTAERYALSLDKASHFWGGTVEADFFSAGFEWSGLDAERALLYGAVMGTVVSLAVEWTDAYAPTHGFSMKDLACGVTGAFYPYLQRKIDVLQSVNVKASYWNHVPRFFSQDWNIVAIGGGKFTSEQNKSRSLIDNYGNQTYWVIVRAKDVLPSAWESPSWLGLALGGRAGDLFPEIGHDHQFREFQAYLSIDIDVVQFLPEEGPLWTTMRRILSHIHFPSPAIRLTPRVRMFGFYM